MKENPGLEHPRLLAIAVTGGAGSGKSIACERLRELGVPVASADQLARQAVEPGTHAYKQIVRNFGYGILAPDGSIDRPKLRRIIIKDVDARKNLESIVHPEVLRLIKQHLKEAEVMGSHVAAVEVPLLFESGMQGFFDYVIMVGASRGNRIQRIITRDNATRGEAEALIDSQMPEKQKVALSDFVINNNESPADVYGEIDRIYKKLKLTAKKGKNG